MTRPVFVIGRYGPSLKAPAIPVAKKEPQMKTMPITSIRIVPMFMLRIAPFARVMSDMAISQQLIVIER
jgi:hypothetical protein